MQGDKVLVRVLMTHEMESGQRKDAAGKAVPAHFIREVSVRHNGRPVLTAQWGPAVSKNPYLQFAFAGGKPGDRIQVSWVDTAGDTRSDETTIG
jgi:sulfur-oxidizing protein SoxZ